MEQRTSPISYRVNVARLPQKGMPVDILATLEQRTELAAIHELVSIPSFKAELMVTPWKRNGVRVAGRVKAQVRQECVVTLEPLDNVVDEAFESLFLPESSKLGREGFGQGGEIILDVEGDDSPETFAGDWIDVGALAEEYFGLGLDPYPRKSSEMASPAAPVDDDEPAEGSFAHKLKAALGRKGG